MTRSATLAAAGAALLGLLLAVAALAPVLAPYDPALRAGLPFDAPSRAHPLGTDDVGHDLLSTLLYGARISLLVGVVAALVSTLLGTVVGVLAGYSRGALDTVLMRLVDVVLALPVLPLTIVVGVFAGPGLGTQIAVIAAVTWAGTARELRAQVLSLRERDHLQALRAMGARPGYVLPRHVLPAVAPLVAPQFVLAVKTAIGLEAALAFLGLGDLTAPSWGTLLSLAHARSAFLTDAWLWWVIPPGLAIALTVLAFALLGAAFDEQARPGRARRSRVERRGAPLDPAAGPPLVISGLTVRYGGGTPAVDGVDLTVGPGEVVGLLGGSGSGKSTIAAAALGLLPAGAAVTAGSVRVGGHDLATLSPAALRGLRGARVALVPQEAMSALNPVRTVGHQLAEAVRVHRRCTRTAARRRAGELLAMVGLDPSRAGEHPHRFSGGMRQRVAIALALAGDPALVIADEPTGGLDVLRRAEILDLLDGLRERTGLALLVITHDLPVVERIADRIAVLCEGGLVETGTATAVLTAPEHPYTRELVASAPRLAPLVATP
ncbi:ATP-binding cassette domain-containing protein [Pseudonocardia saturnea]